MSALLSDPRAVFTLRRNYWTNGYRPLAIWGPEQSVGNPGKQPVGKGWQEAARRDPPLAVISPPDPRALNTGILCDEVRCVDIDVLDAELVEQIAATAERRLGAGLVRIGKAPKAAVVYRATEGFSKIETPEFALGGAKAQVEILARGQQFVASGVHPETMAPYTWSHGAPENVKLLDLPPISEKQAHEIADCATKLIIAAGGIPLKKKKTANSPKSGGGFFAKVNAATLENIVAWAPLLFPDGRTESTGAWRISSEDLGRDLEEDLSIHPSGIRDWGEEQGLTAIDLIVKFDGKALDEAALWLCERLGIDPGELGWRQAPPGLLDQFNKQYAVVNEAGKVWVFEEQYDAQLRRNVIVRFDFSHFKRMYMNRRVELMTPNGKPSSLELGEYWLKHERRRQYLGGVVFDPTGQSPADRWNLWSGFAVEPRKGDWSLIYAHIDKVICSGVAEDREYLLNTIARMVQQPHRQAEVAVVLCGQKGCGKGVLCVSLRRLWGQHGAHISSAKQLVGDFNAHLRDCVYLFADEAFYAGDRQHESVLKALITEPTIAIEGKYQHVILVPNSLHIWMAANADWVVPASHDERRYFVLNVPNARVGDKAYFVKLLEQLEEGGLAAMLYDMLERDISKFDHRAIPQTAALAEQKRLSLDTLDAWWLAVLDRGHVWRSRYGLSEFLNWETFVPTELLSASYLQWCQGQRVGHPSSRELLGKRMSELYKTSRPRGASIIGETEVATEDRRVIMQERPSG